MSNWGFVGHSRSSLSRFKTLRFQNNTHSLSSSSSFFFSSTSGEGPAQNENPVRPTPPPVRVQLTESAGRGVFASRRIGAGELIHTAKPLVSHPSLSTIQRVCYFCLRKLRNGDADQPQSVAFCSEDCEHQAKVCKSDAHQVFAVLLLRVRVI